MERLTERDSEGVVALICREGCLGGPACLECEQRAVDRLAAYEDTGYAPGHFEDAMDAIKAHLWDVEQELGAYKDTGLEPEEIKELCTDDVAKIAKLFRHMIEDGSIDHLQELLEAEKDGRLVVLPCKVGDTIYQLRKPGHARGPGVSPRIVSCIEIRGRDYAVCHQGMEPCLKRDLGKTWFLTLQEAEEALGKEAENG